MSRSNAPMLAARCSRAARGAGSPNGMPLRSTRRPPPLRRSHRPRAYAAPPRRPITTAVTGVSRACAEHRRMLQRRQQRQQCHGVAERAAPPRRGLPTRAAGARMAGAQHGAGAGQAARLRARAAPAPLGRAGPRAGPGAARGRALSTTGCTALRRRATNFSTAFSAWPSRPTTRSDTSSSSPAAPRLAAAAAPPAPPPLRYRAFRASSAACAADSLRAAHAALAPPVLHDARRRGTPRPSTCPSAHGPALARGACAPSPGPAPPW